MNPPRTRRGFLGLGAGLLDSLRAAATGEPIIDTHIHLFLPEFPYHANATYRPPAHPLGEYLAFLQTSPITHVVVVHPEPYQDDHRVLEFVFAHEPSPRFFKATCLFDPIDPKTPQRMAALSRQYPDRIVAIRIHELHKPGTPPSTAPPIKDRDLHHPGMKNVFRAARELKMAIQFQLIPFYAPQASELAREFPDVPIILDHLALAHEGTPQEVDRAFQMSRLPNVYIKYSGPHAGDAVLAKRAFDAFGANHMICGYVGMNAADYRKWNADFDRVFASISAADRARIRVATAQSLFRW